MSKRTITKTIEREETRKTRIERDITGWIGWDYIEKCVDLCGNPFLAMAIFLTGGRATEVLELQRDHFSDLGPYFEVREMPVFKKYDLIKKYIDDEGKERWITQSRIENREPFPILKVNPLAERFWKELEKYDGKLFEYKIPGSDELWKDQYWQVYKRISSIDAPPHRMAPKDDNGEQKNLYPHWFRGMRAAQMRIEYNMSADNLQRFFKWENAETALDRKSVV